MNDFHPNTLRLIKIHDEIIELGFLEKYDLDFCYEVAKASGELGNDYPSDEAIKLAESWLKEFRESGKIKALERNEEYE